MTQFNALNNSQIIFAALVMLVGFLASGIPRLFAQGFSQHNLVTIHTHTHKTSLHYLSSIPHSFGQIGHQMHRYNYHFVQIIH
jgi:hypothetical protein